MKLSKTYLLEKERTYSLKGICMLMIIIHHIVLLWGGPSYLSFFTTSWGFLGTGVFFFLSGYGLFYSLKKSDKVCSSWLWNKLKKLIYPFIFAFIVYLLLSFFIEKEELNQTMIYSLIQFRIPHTTTWFLKAIIGLYILSFVFFRTKLCLSNKVYSIAICTFIFFIYAFFKLSAEWHWSILNFPAGMLLALYVNPYHFVESKYCKKVFWLSFIFMGLIIIYIISSIIHLYVLQSLIFSAIVIFVLIFFDSRLGILNYIGQQSINFYLFQMIFLHFGLLVFDSLYAYGVFVLISTYLLSLCYDKINKNIIK